jgi:glycosyltransferase involved in cell wall biosynthesis
LKTPPDLPALKVAWLLTVAPRYWQPLLAEFTRLLPKTIVFTAGWPGFLDGFAQSLHVQVVGERKLLRITPGRKGYGTSIMILPLGIIWRLLQLSPDIIFADGFCLWTLLVLLLKPFFSWRVIIFYAGSSPAVDARNSKVRLSYRRTLARLADGFVTNHAGGGTYLTDTLAIPAQRVFVRPFLVSQPQAMLSPQLNQNPNPSPTQFKVGTQQPLMFLYVGQLISRKGVQELLTSCLRLNEQGCRNYQLLIIGEGEQYSSLTYFCQEHGLEQVKWLGRLDYSQLGLYFEQADVFIFPTLEDVWGMVVPEAMSFGKPILCSKWAGAADLVVPEQNGFIFDPQDSQVLAQLMCQFIEHPEWVPLFGEQSLKLIQEHTPKKAATFLAEVTMAVFNS